MWDIDVYKRQTLDRTLRWVQRQVAPTLKMLKKIDKGNGTDYMETIEPVSYTHLDVYKRQILRVSLLLLPTFYLMETSVSLRVKLQTDI